MSFELLTKQMDQHPNKKAVVFEGQSITYADLHGRILSAAKSLSVLGVVPGHKVVVSLHNSIEYLVLHYAIARLGAVIVPFSTGYPYEEISVFCAECKPSAYLIEPELVDVYQRISREISKGIILHSGEGAGLQRILDSYSDNEVVLTEDDFSDFPSIIHYNTPNAPGTGERFKGSVQTQGSHFHRMQNWISSAEMTADDSTLCMHPLTHAFGSDTISLPALSSGQTLYLMDCRSITPIKVLELLSSHQITIFGALPWLYKALIELEGVGANTNTLASLRLAMSAGTPLTVEVAEDFYKRFQVRLSNAYGMTEVSVALFNFFEQGSEDLLSVGKPIHGVEVKLVGGEVPTSGVGELWIRSKGFATQYFAQDQVLYNDSGWLQTGDLVKREDDGSYLMLGRVSQVFEVDGRKVLPAEIESVLTRHPDVEEVAVVPADVEGETQLAAFIVAQKPLTEEQIKQFFLFQGVSHLNPKYLVFRDQLPKSSTGKISKAKLIFDSKMESSLAS